MIPVFYWVVVDTIGEQVARMSATVGGIRRASPACCLAHPGCASCRGGAAPSERIRQFDLRFQRHNPPLGFPGRQVPLEQFRLIRLGAERAQRRQLAGRHRGVQLVGEAGH
jgi:hypothetical protein